VSGTVFETRGTINCMPLASVVTHLYTNRGMIAKVFYLLLYSIARRTIFALTTRLLTCVYPSSFIDTGFP